jgi:polyphenol oxidase
VALRALEAMQALGADPTRTSAWLGPSVCAACYEVPDQMRADVVESAPAAWATSRSGTPALDLRAGLAQALQEAGVAVQTVGPCTAESPDHYSYRRDGRTGRFAGVVWAQPL